MAEQEDKKVRVTIIMRSGEALYINCTGEPVVKKDPKGVLVGLSLPGANQRILFLDLPEVACITIEVR